MAIAYTGNGASVTGQSVAYPSAIGAIGNLLVACCIEASSTDPGVPTDTQGNTWVDCGQGFTLLNSSSVGIKIAYTNAKSAAACTVNWGSAYALQIFEFSGVATSSPVDVGSKRANATAGSGSNNVSVPSMTTTGNGELVLALFACNSGPLSAGTGFTSPLGDQHGLTEWKIQTTAGAITITATDGTNSDNYGSIAVSFKVPVSGFTGTGSVATKKAAISAAGTATAPTFSGSASLAAKRAGISAAGAATAPVFSGTAGVASRRAATTASGSTAVPIFSGTASVTAKKAAITAAGTAVVPTFSGTSTVATRKATLSAAGTAVAPVFTGTASLSAARAAIASAGTVTVAGVAGSAAVATRKATLSAAGTAVAPVFPGTANIATRSATITAAGTAYAPGVHGSASLVSAKAAIAAAGAFTILEINGITAIAARRAAIHAAAAIINPVTSAAMISSRKAALHGSGIFTGLTPMPAKAIGTVTKRGAAVAGVGRTCMVSASVEKIGSAQ